MNTRAKILVAIALFFTIALGRAGFAAEYYVDRNNASASDSNAGSETNPWLTIQKAANTMVAGDTCYVKTGVYDERIRPANCGEEGNLITYKAVGNAVVRGFLIEVKTHLRIIGFEITHTINNAYSAVQLYSADYCVIENNNIHHTYGMGIYMHKRYPTNNAVIRGNTLSYIGSVPGREVGDMGIHISGNKNLVEYNDVSHVADFINVWGVNNIIRNNYFHDLYLEDFPDYADTQGHHVDGVQYYSDDAGLLRRTLVECNLFFNTSIPHAHLVILQDHLNHGSAELIFRRNAALRNGSYGVLVDYQFDNFRFYNNTLADMLSEQSPKGSSCLQFSNGSTGAKVLNNVFYDCARADGALYAVDDSSGAGFYADYNLAYLSGNPSEAHGILNEAPEFVDYGASDLHLSSGSPAIDSGGPITRTVSAGSGRVISVEDANYFTDGWGIAEGDIIKVGTNGPAVVTSVDYESNTLTVKNSISWSANEPVNLAYLGTGPDMGAFEYRSGGYQYGISIVSPANGASVSRPVEIQTSVANPYCVRFVIFYVNGIPIGKVGSAPYTFTWNPAEEKTYKIEARAYARYPDATLRRSAEIEVDVRRSDRSITPFLYPLLLAE